MKKATHAVKPTRTALLTVEEADDLGAAVGEVVFVTFMVLLVGGAVGDMVGLEVGLEVTGDLVGLEVTGDLVGLEVTGDLVGLEVTGDLVGDVVGVPAAKVNETARTRTNNKTKAFISQF